MTLKVGIVGTGWGARIQVPAFRYAGLEVTALWAHSEDKAQKVAADLSIPFYTTDYRTLIARGDVDLVSVVTPPHTHAEISIAALEAGKHVLCEKPTALNAGEAALMLAAAKARPNQLALIDHELRFAPTRQKMRALIGEGYVGEIYHVEGTASGAGLLNPARLWHWWSDREAGGGLWGAIGSHVVDSLTWLTGQKITALNGSLRTFITSRADSAGALRPVTSDDYGIFQMRFDGGASGLINLSFVTAGPFVNRLLVVGSRGSLRYEGERLTGYRANVSEPEDFTATESLGAPEAVMKDDFGRGTFYIAKAIKAALESGDRSALEAAATFEDGLTIQHVLDAGKKSSEAGAWVSIEY